MWDKWLKKDIKGDRPIISFIQKLLLIGLLGYMLGSVYMIQEKGAAFKDIGEVLEYMYDMVSMGAVAFGMTVLIAALMFWRPIQSVLLPFFDELYLLSEKWKRGETISMAEAILGVAFAIVTATVAAAVLNVIGNLATPMG